MKKFDFETFNPSSGELLGTYFYLSDTELGKKIEDSVNGFERWRRCSLFERASSLKFLAAELRRQSANLAKIASTEMGKPILESLAEVEKCAISAEFFADNCERFLSAEFNEFAENRSQVQFAPLGPILAIMPWNFPVWQVVRFGIPALLAGNSILLKHSDLVPETAQLIENIFHKSLAVPNAFLNLRVSHSQVEDLAADFRIRALTFTGSTRGGREVAALAGRNLKKSVLELGGADAYLVLKDAKLSQAIEACIKARFSNNGQSCVAGKRFFVADEIYDQFVEEFLIALQKRKVGPALELQTDNGPLAHQRFQLQLQSQVDALIQLGNQRIFSSPVGARAGAYFPLTVIEMQYFGGVWTEELFGPVALIWKFSEEKSAVADANRSIYGLGAAVFSEDNERAQKIAQELNCGFVAINDFVKSDPRLPFGGVKDSGYGRELSRYGLLEFVNIKTVLQKG